MLHGNFKSELEKHKFYFSIVEQISFILGGNFLCPQEEHQVTDEVVCFVSALPEKFNDRRINILCGPFANQNENQIQFDFSNLYYQIISRRPTVVFKSLDLHGLSKISDVNLLKIAHAGASHATLVCKKLEPSPFELMRKENFKL